MSTLREEIQKRLSNGYQIVSETETSAQLVQPKKISVAWLIVSICTLVGWVPYLGYHFLFKRQSGIYLSVDAQGVVQESSHRR